MHSRPILHYGGLPPLLKRKSFRRTLWLGVFLLIAIAANRWGPGLGLWSKTMYWQHRCMTCTLPADQVVLDYDMSQINEVTYATKMEDLDARFENRQINPRPRLVFLHELQRPDGKLRLVEVNYFVTGMYGHHCEINFTTDLWIPGGLETMPSYIGATFQRPGFYADSGKLRVFAGQIDPGNASHFTVTCESNGTRNIIDGWLDNQDHILISPRP